MRYQIARYGYVGLSLADANVVKTREATYSAKPTIMTPPASLVPPPPRPGYSSVSLPTWCSVGEVCSGVLTREYEKRMGSHLPPRDRGTVVDDQTIARMS